MQAWFIGMFGFPILMPSFNLGLDSFNGCINNFQFVQILNFESCSERMPINFYDH